MTLVDIPEIVPQEGGGTLVVADVAVLIVFERGVGVYRRFWQSVQHEEVYLRAYDSVTDARSAFRTVSLSYAFAGRCQTLAVNAFTAHALPGAR
jgi:hypothetical protein